MARQIATALANIARDAHWERNPTTGLFERALLLEGSRTNSFTSSENITDPAYWTPVRAGTAANVTTAPDGTATADKLLDSIDAATTHYLNKNPGATADNAPQTVSYFLKAADYSWVRISIVAKDGSDAGVYFDLATGALGTQDASATGRITALGNGWYRCAVTRASSMSGATPLQGRLWLAIGNGIYAFTGTGSLGVFVWGGQFEVDAAFASSYIPTTTVAVTRAADALSFPFTLPPQEMTVYARFIERGTAISSGSARVVQIGHNAAGEGGFLVHSSFPGYRALHHNGAGAGSIATANLPAPVIGTLVEMRAVLRADGSCLLAIAENGGAEVATALTAAHALGPKWGELSPGAGPRLGVGNTGAGGAVGFNAFQSVKVARGIKSLTQMRALAPVS